jgi:hypothetical protein
MGARQGAILCAFGLHLSATARMQRQDERGHCPEPLSFLPSSLHSGHVRSATGSMMRMLWRRMWRRIPLNSLAEEVILYVDFRKLLAWSIAR